MLLKQHLQLEKYGQAAVKYLKNGKIRYYGKYQLKKQVSWWDAVQLNTLINMWIQEKVQQYAKVM